MIEYFTIFQSSYYTNSDPMRNPFFDFQTLQMKLKHNQALLGLRDLFLTYFAVAATMKKGFLRNFTKFTGKHLCQSIFFNKVAGLRAATLLKKRPWHRCLPVNFAKFLRTPFLHYTSGRLLVNLLLSADMMF